MRPAEPDPAASPPRWGIATIVVHWLSAGVVIGLLGLGGAMVHGGFDTATTFDLFQSHKSLGVAAAVLAVLRLALRATTVAPPLPATTRRHEVWAARTTHGLLLALPVVAVASGWLVVSTAPLPVPTRVFGLFTLPPIAAPDAARFAVAVQVHGWATWAIAGLAAVHVAAAVKHAVVDRDGTIRRMLP